MTQHVTPKRMKGNQVFIPTLGTIIVPCGISFLASRPGRSPTIILTDINKKQRAWITVSNPTPESWLRLIKFAVTELVKFRPTLLCRRPLKSKVVNGPIPGSGQPGVYAGGNYPCPIASDPLEKVKVYTHSLRNAISIREGAEERYNEYWAFDESFLIPVGPRDFNALSVRP